MPSALCSVLPSVQPGCCDWTGGSGVTSVAVMRGGMRMGDVVIGLWGRRDVVCLFGMHGRIGVQGQKADMLDVSR